MTSPRLEGLALPELGLAIGDTMHCSGSDDGDGDGDSSLLMGLTVDDGLREPVLLPPRSPRARRFASLAALASARLRRASSLAALEGRRGRGERHCDGGAVGWREPHLLIMCFSLTTAFMSA